MNTTTTPTLWWGERTLPVDGTGRWRIGPLGLRATRRRREWVLAHERSDDERDTTLEVRVPDDAPPAEEGGDRVRYAFADSPDRIRVVPALADRPLVFSALTPFKVPAGEAVTLYMSSAVWIDVFIGGDRSLLEIPSWRPSDTWFGPNTRVGELCYASQTRARMTLDDDPGFPHRALSVVRIENRGRSPLPIERIKLPMPALSLYGTPGGGLYTEGMTLRRESDDELAEVRLSGSPPSEARGGTHLGGPRVRVSRGLVHVFGRLFDDA